MKRTMLILSALIIAGCFGCHSPTGELQVIRGDIRIVKDDLKPSWDEVLDVLSEHNFAADYQSLRVGRIITEPVVSQQWFEFWRDDAQGRYQWLESSLHTMRRRVEVTFAPANDGYRMTLFAYVERKSQPERQVTTASGAIQIYREKLPIYTGEKVAAGEQVYWVDVGRDDRLEAYLLERIASRLGVGVEPAEPEESDVR